MKNQDNISNPQEPLPPEQKKVVKILSIVLIVLAILLCLSFCWNNKNIKDDIVGHTYSGGTVTNGLYTTGEIDFYTDYTFEMRTEALYQNESYKMVGTYKIDGNQVTLIVQSGNNPVYTYNAKTQALSNGNITLYKVR